MARLATLKFNKPSVTLFGSKVATTASPIFIYRSPKTGVLLLHGFTAAPSEMSGLAEYLANRNISVYAPLLAGHGKTVDELANTTIRDWQKSAIHACLSLREVVEKIYVVGSSLGGNLAFYLANHFRDLFSGVVSIGTPIRVKWQRLFKTGLYTLGIFKKYQRKTQIFYPPAADRQMVEDFRPLMPVRSVRNLFKFIDNVTIPNLSRVRTPTLVIQSTRDPIIDPVSARFIYENLAAPDKRILWLDSKNHTLNRVADEARGNIVFESIYKFVTEK